jgi:outer membrane immunogenic protein
MRWVICALAVCVLAPQAMADDFDFLRGSQPVGPALFTRWSGFYVGGDFGYSDERGDFRNATQTPIAFILRNTTLENEFAPSQWQVLGTSTAGNPTFGGFVGYNTQWQDLILGVEGNYNQANLNNTASSFPISRITPADSSNTVYLVNLNGSGSANNLDYGTLRTRAGWIVGNFLPYGFFGLAVGKADISVTSTISGATFTGAYPVCPCGTFSQTATTGRNSQVLVGFDAGLGLDVLLTQNIFLRGEYEFVQFAPVSGVNISINSVRAGGGFKF